MPRISEFYGIIIYMYSVDHAPPHFHVLYSGHKATVSISDVAIMDGWLPPRARNMVLEWAGIHKEELAREWELAMSKLPLFRIDPLV